MGYHAGLSALWGFSHLILTATLGSSHKEGSLCFSILYLRKPRLRKNVLVWGQCTLNVSRLTVNIYAGTVS